MSSLYDNQFAYAHDNPFVNNAVNKKIKLTRYIDENADQFVNFDVYDDSRFLIKAPNTTELFETKLESDNISENPISNYIKDFMISIKDVVSEDMFEWATKTKRIKQTNNSTVPNTTCKSDDSVPDYANTSFFGMVSEGDYLNNLTNYDTSPNRFLSYDEVCQLTINLARRKLIPEKRDETIVAMEMEKKKMLMQEISCYRDVTSISALDSTDITDYTVTQLELYRDKLSRMHDDFKLKDITERGIDVLGAAYGTLFPDGIKISKTKKLNLNGTGKELVSTLFDNRSSVGLSFKKFTQKHHIHISDEAMVGTTILSILIKNVKIETIEPEEGEEDKTSPEYTYYEYDDNEDEDDGVVEELEEVSA